MNHEELYTLLLETEKLISNRPITYVYSCQLDQCLTPLTFCQPIRNLPHYPSRGTLTISLTLNGFYTLFQCFHCWLYTNKYRLGCDQPSKNFNKMDLINTANTYKCWSYAFRGSGLIFILTTRDGQISHEKK